MKRTYLKKCLWYLNITPFVSEWQIAVNQSDFPLTHVVAVVFECEMGGWCGCVVGVWWVSGKLRGVTPTVGIYATTRCFVTSYIVGDLRPPRGHVGGAVGGRLPEEAVVQRQHDGRQRHGEHVYYHRHHADHLLVLLRLVQPVFRLISRKLDLLLG